MKTTKSIKFHTSENPSKTSTIKSFLKECNNVGNTLLYLHFGCIIETNKYDFIKKTKDYNNVFFKIRSHHYQQIQEKVFNMIWLRYNKVIKQTKFDSPKLNYLKYFAFKWGDVEEYLTKKISKTKNNQFYKDVLNYWLENQRQIKNLITKTVLNKIRSVKLPKFRKLTLKVDSRTTLFQESKTNYFKYWLNLITNTKIGKRYQNLYLPIKWSKYHEEQLNNTKLNNSFIIKWDGVYDRLEIIGTYNQELKAIEVTKPCRSNTLGVDVGVTNLLTFSNGYQLDTKSLQIEFEKFLKYEKQVKRLESKSLYNSNKYLRKQNQLTNKIENQINQTLNNIPEQFQYVVFENLKFKDRLSRKINYLIRRFRVQGILPKRNQNKDILRLNQ